MHPFLFHIGNWPIRTWGVAFIIAVAIAVYWAMVAARKQNIDAGRVFELGAWVVVGALLGARLLYVLLDLKYYLMFPRALWSMEGLSFHGGVVGGFLAGYIYARIARLPVARMADIAAPPLALGYAITRIGCYFNGCCYGIPTDAPWGVVFFDVPRHPTQFYALGGGLLVLAALLWLRRRKPFHGYVWLMYMGLYSVQRFVVEIWRENVKVAGWLSEAQLASIIVAVGSFAAVWYLSGRLPTPAESDAAERGDVETGPCSVDDGGQPADAAVDARAEAEGEAESGDGGTGDAKREGVPPATPGAGAPVDPNQGL